MCDYIQFPPHSIQTGKRLTIRPADGTTSEITLKNQMQNTSNKHSLSLTGNVLLQRLTFTDLAIDVENGDVEVMGCRFKGENSIDNAVIVGTGLVRLTITFSHFEGFQYNVQFFNLSN